MYKTALRTLWVVGNDFDASSDASAYAHTFESSRHVVGIALVLLLPGRMGGSAILRFLSARTVSLEVQGFIALQIFTWVSKWTHLSVHI